MIDGRALAVIREAWESGMGSGVPFVEAGIPAGESLQSLYYDHAHVHKEWLSDGRRYVGFWAFWTPVGLRELESWMIGQILALGKDGGRAYSDEDFLAMIVGNVHLHAAIKTNLLHNFLTFSVKEHVRRT
jgi:hypothetical protein